MSEPTTPGLRLPWHRETVGHSNTGQIADKVLADLNYPLPDNFPPNTDATWIVNADNKVVAFVGNGPRQTENADYIIEAVGGQEARANADRELREALAALATLADDYWGDWEKNGGPKSRISDVERLIGRAVQ